MASLKIRKGGEWRTIVGCSVYRGSRWRQVSFIKIYKGGAWRTVTFSYPAADGGSGGGGGGGGSTGGGSTGGGGTGGSSTGLTASASPPDTEATGSSPSTMTTDPVTVTPTGGTVPYTYAWVCSGVTITSATSATTTFKKALSSPGSEYLATATCTVTDAIGRTATATCDLTFTRA